MPTINVNYYIRVDTKSSPVPLYIKGDVSNVNNAIPISTTPFKSPVNDKLTNPFYFNDGGVIRGELNFIYIPEGYTIDYNNIYVFDEASSTWQKWSISYMWFHDTNTTTTDDGGNTYSVVNFSCWDEDDEEWKYSTQRISFQLTNN